MAVKQDIDELERIHKTEMDKLPADKQKLVREAMSRMSVATTIEELHRLEQQEIETFKNGS